MTVLDIYEHTLTEINKLEAPHLLLEDFNYLLNKAITQYCNLVYARFETNQQAIDDLRTLKTTVKYPVEDIRPLMFTLPADYFHIIGMVVESTKDATSGKCEGAEKTVTYSAGRLNSAMDYQVMNNAYLKPSPTRPYYYIHNTGSGLVKNDDDMYEPENPSLAQRFEVKVGPKTSKYTVKSVYLDYLRKPLTYKLTRQMIDDGKSDTVEFPEYICYEIINILVRLVLENASDPRIQSHVPLNQTIMTPAQ